MSATPGIIYISSVPAAPQAGGPILIHRHFLRLASECDITTLDGIGPGWGWWGLVRRLASVAGKLGFRKAAESLHLLGAGRWADPLILRRLKLNDSAVVLTVAHGDLASAASRCARKTNRKLVTIFHDWWPDIPALPAGMRSLAEKRFIQLHKDSDVSLPVCPGMQAWLGPHPDSQVLYPIAEASDTRPASPPSDLNRPFRILYAGNLQEYGPMLEGALRASLDFADLRLEVRGHQPRWDPDFVGRMRSTGQLLEYAPRDQLEDWLQSADAFLIPMRFEAGYRRRMETSFPSKLTEFARYARPLVIWGPEYCSAHTWASASSAALAISDRDPRALLAEIQRLARNPQACSSLGASASAAFNQFFSPAQTHQVLVSALFSDRSVRHGLPAA